MKNLQTFVWLGLFSTYIFSADIAPEMLKHGRVIKVKMLFLVLVFVFNFDLFKISAAILEKGLFKKTFWLFEKFGVWRYLHLTEWMKLNYLKVNMVDSYWMKSHQVKGIEIVGYFKNIYILPVVLDQKWF